MPPHSVSILGSRTVCLPVCPSLCLSCAQLGRWPTKPIRGSLPQPGAGVEGGRKRRPLSREARFLNWHPEFRLGTAVRPQAGLVLSLPFDHLKSGLNLTSRQPGSQAGRQEGSRWGRGCAVFYLATRGDSKSAVAGEAERRPSCSQMSRGASSSSTGSS